MSENLFGLTVATDKGLDNLKCQRLLSENRRYARSSLTMKQKALERVSDSPVPSMPSWQKSRSTMEWLKSFGSQKA